ncbi:MAG TPA: hypothetical protein VI356_13260 [Myxococcales bacterium]
MTTRLTRFVHKDGNAHAVYYAMFSENHPNEPVPMLVSLGEWGEHATPAQRVAFVMDLREAGSNWEVSLTDAAASPWREVTFAGRILDRQEALRHPLVQEAFHVIDHAVVEDGPLQAHFARLPSSRPNDS